MQTHPARCCAAAVLLLLVTTLPSGAQIDAAALTCGEFNAADGVGRDAYGRAVLLWADNTRNWRQSGTLSAWFVNDTKKDVRQKISRACVGRPAGETVVVALQSSQ